jgi:hypothetical protein
MSSGVNFVKAFDNGDVLCAEEVDGVLQGDFDLRYAGNSGFRRGVLDKGEVVFYETFGPQGEEIHKNCRVVPRREIAEGEVDWASDIEWSSEV